MPLRGSFKGARLDRRLAVAVSVTTAAALLYYVDAIPPVSAALCRIGYPLTRHAVQRILFLIPIGYVALVYGLIGGVIVLFLSALVMMPRALFLSPAPLDALSEVAATAFAGGTLAWLIDRLGRERLERERMALRLEATSILNTMARCAGESLDLEELLDKTLSGIVATMNIQLGAIYMVDDATGRLVPRAHVGLSEEQVAEIERLRHTVADWSERVASRGVPSVIEDIRGNPHLVWLLSHLEDKEKLRSYINVPLGKPERILGTMGLVTTPGHQLDEWDVQLLTAIGHQAGPAIHNAKLLEQTGRIDQELRAFFDIAAEAASVVHVDRMLSLVCERAQQLSKSQFAAILLCSEDGQSLVKGAVASQGPGMAVPFPSRMPVGQGVSGKVAADGQAIVVEDYLKDQRISHELDFWAEKRRMRSTAAVPIRMADRMLGVLVASRTRVQIYSEHDVEVLSMLANQAGMALENARLYEEIKCLATLQERDRIAGEMHDRFAQSLGYLNLQCLRVAQLMSTGRPDEAGEELERLRHIVRQAYEDVREGIFALRLAASEGNGFIPSVLGYLRDFEAQSGIGTELVIDGEGANRLSPAAELQLIRIIQEALTNVRKHTKASKARVSIQHVGEEAKITIEDDGAGFDPGTLHEETARHFGLRFMRERAKGVSGSVEIETKPGLGTKVIVKVPVAGEAEWRTQDL